MPRLSTLSNPTGLKDLERRRVGIVVADLGSSATYSLARLDLDGADLPAQARVIVIAQRGNAELRTDHGSVDDLNKGFIDASELGADGTWSFRVLFVLPGSPKLIATVESVRPDGLGDSESLIGLEAASDLEQVPWELVVRDQEGRAVIRFNREIYPNAAAAAADLHFGGLVFPEAVRQLAVWHAQHPGSLADAHWEPFKTWLTLHGITDEPDDDQSIEEAEKWCRGVVAAFSARHRIAEKLRAPVIQGEAD